MAKFKVKNYELFANSKSKIYAYAVIFKNFGSSEFPEGRVVASFHISKELAEKTAKWSEGQSHLQIIEIQEVEQV